MCAFGSAEQQEDALEGRVANLEAGGDELQASALSGGQEGVVHHRGLQSRTVARRRLRHAPPRATTEAKGGAVGCASVTTE